MTDANVESRIEVLTRATAVPAAPITFENFKFSTIGRPPALLTRFSDPSSQLVTPSQLPEVNEGEGTPTYETYSSSIKPKPMSRPSLLDSLAAAAVAERDNPASSKMGTVAQQPSRVPRAQTSRPRSSESTVVELHIPPSNRPAALDLCAAEGDSAGYTHFSTIATGASRSTALNAPVGDPTAVSTHVNLGVSSDAAAALLASQTTQSTLFSVLAPFYMEAGKEEAEWSSVVRRAEEEQREFVTLVEKASVILDKLKEKACRVEVAVDAMKQHRGDSMARTARIEQAAISAIEEYRKQIDQAIRAQKLQEECRLSDLASAAEARRLEDANCKAVEAAAEAEARRLAEERRKVELAEAARRKMEEEKRAAQLRALEEKKRAEEFASREREAAQQREQEEERRRLAEYEAKRAAIEAERNRQADENAARMREKLQAKVTREKQELLRSRSDSQQVPPIVSAREAASCTASGNSVSPPVPYSSSSQERVLSGGVKLAVPAKSGASPSPASPSVVNSHSPRPASAVGAKPISAGLTRIAATTKSSANGGFVPAQTQAGKTVSTEMPFSSIQLASEAKRRAVPTSTPTSRITATPVVQSPSTNGTVALQEPSQDLSSKTQDKTNQDPVITVKSEPGTQVPQLAVAAKGTQTKKLTKKAKDAAVKVAVKREPSLEYTPGPSQEQSLGTPTNPSQSSGVVQEMGSSNLPSRAADGSQGLSTPVSPVLDTPFASNVASSSSLDTRRTTAPPSSGLTSTSYATSSSNNYGIASLPSRPPSPQPQPQPAPKRRPKRPSVTVPDAGNQDRNPAPSSASRSASGPRTPPVRENNNVRGRQRRQMDHYSPPPRTEGWTRREPDHYSPLGHRLDERVFTPPDSGRKRSREGDTYWPENDVPPRQRPRYDDGPGLSYVDRRRTPPAPDPRYFAPRPTSPGRPWQGQAQYSPVDNGYAEPRYEDYRPPYHDRVPPPISPPANVYRDGYERYDNLRPREIIPPPDAHDDYTRGGSLARAPASPTTSKREGRHIAVDTPAGLPEASASVDSEQPSLFYRLSNPSPSHTRTSPNNPGGRRAQAKQRRGPSLTERVGGRAGGHKPLADRITMA